MAELIDIHKEFHLGNRFILDTAKHLAEMLPDSYRIVVKYGNVDTPKFNDDIKTIEFATSRESHNVPISFYRDDIYAIFSNYFMLDKWGLPMSNPLAYPLPIGTFIDFDNAPEIKPLPERKYDFSFIGQIPHTGTRDCFKRNMENMLKEQKKKSGKQFKYFLQYTEGFGKGMSKEDYIDLLNDSKIVLCPTGAYSLETFRFFEAIKMGAIPLVEQLPKFWYYEKAPYFYGKWQRLDTILSNSLNFLNSEQCRSALQNVAQYNATVLDERVLATHLINCLKARDTMTDIDFKKQLENARKTASKYD